MQIRCTAAAALVGTLLLTGCSGTSEEQSKVGGAAPTSDVASEPGSPDLRSTPPADLFTRSEDLRHRLVPLLDGLDLRQAATAPTLQESPVPRALLVATLSVFSPEPDHVTAEVVAGRPYVLTPTGEWRRVEVADYGLAPNLEQPFAISPDGRRIAIAGVEPGRLAITELGSGETMTKDLPTDEPAGLRWSKDSTEISWFDRDRNTKFYRYDRRTDRISQSNLHSLQAAYVGDETQVAEVLLDGVLRLHDHDTVTEQDLEYPDLAQRMQLTAGGPLLAWGRRPNQDEIRATVVAVDPADGRLAGALVGPRRGGLRTSPQEWLTVDELLLTQSPSGGLFVWNLRKQELVQVGRFRTRGLNIDVAAGPFGDLMM